VIRSQAKWPFDRIFEKKCPFFDIFAYKTWLSDRNMMKKTLQTRWAEWYCDRITRSQNPGIFFDTFIFFIMFIIINWSKMNPTPFLV
jgi:hypothetical protein